MNVADERRYTTSDDLTAERCALEAAYGRHLALECPIRPWARLDSWARPDSSGGPTEHELRLRTGAWLGDAARGTDARCRGRPVASTCRYGCCEDASMERSEVTQLLRRPGFVRYFATVAGAQATGTMFTVSGVLLILERTHDLALAGIVVAAASLPATVTGPFLGGWLDVTASRRRLLVLDRLLAALALTAILVLADMRRTGCFRWLRCSTAPRRPSRRARSRRCCRRSPALTCSTPPSRLKGRASTWHSSLGRHSPALWRPVQARQWRSRCRSAPASRWAP